MPIQFIDNSSINKKTRTLIRSHVAKGKNLGRTLSRPSRYPRKRQVAAASVIPSPEPCSNQGPNVNDSENLEPSPWPSIERQLQDALSMSLPFGVSRTCRRLFYEFVSFVNVIPYPPGIRTTIIQGRGPRMFLQYAFVDEAFFHCIVAMSVTTAVSLSVTRQETIEAFCHLSRSLRLINQRLGEGEELAISDATLAAIVVMTQHERLLGYDNHALVHFEGLQRIIALRGGISILVSRCQVIAQKALRADFDFALQFGSPLKFAAEYIPGKATLDRLREEHRRARVSPPDMPAFMARMDENLRDVFEDVSTIAWLFNDSAVHELKVDDYDFHNVLLMIGYRLLSVRPLNAPFIAVDRLELLLHLGLVALTNMFFLTIGLKSDISLLSRCIVSATLDHQRDDREEQELSLWLLFIGKASVLRAADEDIRLIPKIHQLATQLGISDWDHMLRSLQKFPWISAFMNDTAQALWDQTGSFSYAPLVS